MRWVRVVAIALTAVSGALGHAYAQSLRLTWQDLSDNEAGFRCERQANGGSFFQVCDVGTNVQTWQDTSILFDVDYCYRVSAYNAAGVSAYSNTACGRATAIAPDVFLQLSCVQTPTAPSSVLATDNFNRANNADLGTSWAILTGEFPWRIIGNTVIPTSLGGDTTERSSGIAWPANQYASVAVIAASGGTSSGTQGVGVALRVSATARTYYRIIIHGGSVINNVTISKFINGVSTTLGFRSVPFVANGRLYAEIVGNTIIVKWNGVALGAPIIDANITTGSPGVTYSSTLSNATLDDWEGGIP